MLKTIWAFLTGGKVVWLEDFDGELTRTIAYKAGFGKCKPGECLLWKKLPLTKTVLFLVNLTFIIGVMNDYDF